MKKAVLLVPVLVMALAVSAFAQVPIQTDKDNSDAVKVTISLNSDLDFVYRDTWINAIRGAGTSLAISGNGWTAGPPIELVATPTTAISNWTRLRLDVALGSDIKGVCELGTDPLADFVDDSAFSVATTTLAGNTFQTLRFWNLYVEMNDAWAQGLNIKVGQVHTTFDIRGRGNSLVYDSFFAPRPGANAINGPVLNSFIENVASAGAVLDYNKGAVTIQAGLFPAVQEFVPTNAQGEDATYYASLFYRNQGDSNSQKAVESVGAKSQLGLIAILFNLPGADANVYTFGGGFDAYLLDKETLELFAQVYMNSGKVGPGVKAKGNAYELGFRYSFPDNDQLPWVEVKMTYLGGDGNGADSNVKNYISQQYQRDLLIIEDPVFGLGLNTNLQVIDIGGGLTFKAGEKNLAMSAILGMARLNKAIPVGLSASNEKTLGNELDVKANYHYSNGVDLNANLAYLFGSDVIEGLTTFSAARTGEDTTWLFTLGAHLHW